MHLLMIELFGYSFTDLIGLIGVVVVFIVGFGGLVKAVQEIITNGWTPTKTKFVEWWHSRRTRPSSDRG